MVDCRPLRTYVISDERSELQPRWLLTAVSDPETDFVTSYDLSAVMAGNAERCPARQRRAATRRLCISVSGVGIC